jgi:hypothetical protein
MEIVDFQDPPEINDLRRVLTPSLRMHLRGALIRCGESESRGRGNLRCQMMMSFIC